MKQPLLSGAHGLSVPSLQGRFLSQDFYDEKRKVFREYKPESWLDTLKIQASTFLAVPLCALIVFTIVLSIVAKVPAFAPAFALSPQIHTTLGAALAFIMVFRTNTSYSRWWEARLQWGVVNNTTRSIVSRAATMMKNEASYTQLTTELVAFAVLLKNHLRFERTSPAELGNMLPYALMATLSDSVNPPLAAIEALAVTVRAGIKTELPADALVANASYLQLSNALDALANAVGACERVRDTPMPFGYVSSLRGFLLLWLFTMPFTIIGPYGLAAIPGVLLVGFLFLNLERMAMEIEQPFGDDADDLPLENYVLRIERVCLDFLKRSKK